MRKYKVRWDDFCSQNARLFSSISSVALVLNIFHRTYFEAESKARKNATARRKRGSGDFLPAFGRKIRESSEVQSTNGFGTVKKTGVIPRYRRIRYEIIEVSAALKSG